MEMGLTSPSESAKETVTTMTSAKETCFAFTVEMPTYPTVWEHPVARISVSSQSLVSLSNAEIMEIRQQAFLWVNARATVTTMAIAQATWFASSAMVKKVYLAVKER